MDRWTMAELKSTDNISFAIQILYERRKGLNPYAPLYQKISEAVSELADIRGEKQKFIAGVAKGVTYQCSREQAEKHGREFIGIDLNPEYTEMAKSRVEAIAGGI